MKLEKRIGKIKIHESFLREPDSHLLKCLFSKFYPTFVYRDREVYVYEGFSPLFDILGNGEMIPLYEMTMTMKADDSFVIKKIERQG